MRTDLKAWPERKIACMCTLPIVEQYRVQNNSSKN